MNTQLVESLLQLIRSLPDQERSLLETKLYNELPYPSPLELAHLNAQSNAFNFLHDEPDLYTLEDGEAIEWQ